MSENLRNITDGKGIPIRENDIDTDRIIPARYMKVVTFEGLGKYAFYDVRFDADGNPKDHPFNDNKYKQGSIMIVNQNFGCGSSREHAPQALQKYGITAISESPLPRSLTETAPPWGYQPLGVNTRMFCTFRKWWKMILTWKSPLIWKQKP
jgi:hypothetical protein